MKNLFKTHPTKSHNIPSNPTIISLLLYIYIISIQLARQKISTYNEIQLYEALAKSGRTKSFAEFGLDKSNDEHCRKVVEISLEQHGKWIESDEWLNSNKKTIGEALKFINKYKS